MKGVNSHKICAVLPNHQNSFALQILIIDLAALDSELPLVALGRAGNDAEGDFIMDKLRAYPNIDLSHIKREGTTSFTLVMADNVTKQRTFYHNRGGNALLCEADIPWDSLDVDMLRKPFGVYLLISGVLLLLPSKQKKDPSE
jgi:sugar/nucleoside kinase (ribokinase family)